MKTRSFLIKNKMSFQLLYYKKVFNSELGMNNLKNKSTSMNIFDLYRRIIR